MSKQSTEELKKLAARLKQHNEWRRGTDTTMACPVQLGRDIDAAINFIEDYLDVTR